ncbi:hypothetical protein [Alkaliphilus hydrothermalis]|uniref:DUF4064 domain-containing protein n=1 Tax=Alkaliphilus hydrothermalis TaxID=1482730 RepID=A0ABS2NLZ9_9FIRM|nr:hypothetical protein [Alkaliphilus hydrothermalis]MBM7613862.1 hypothetical protein [Alkaliphilus hydrothermalis]
MYYRFSKFAKTIIIVNVVLTLAVALIHGYNIHRIKESNEKIFNVMQEKKVIRDTAIRMLENEGEELFINQEFTTYFGMCVSIFTLLLLYKYAKSNGFFFGFLVAISSLFTSFVGGLLLFYLILSGKSEIAGKKERFTYKNDWEKYIHKKVILIENTEDKV